MNEEVLLQRKILDAANKSYRQNIYTYTNFLSISELSVYNSMKKELEFASPETFGGSDACERRIIRFGSLKSLGYEEPYPITVIKISPLTPKFAEELGHRDYLGALMNLGIERSLLGDIIIKEKEAYLFCINHIADFIAENLTTVRKTHVSASKYDYIPEIIKPVLSEFEIIAASARADAVVSALTKMSRNSCLELFSSKKIFVNGIVTENNSSQLKPGDILVIRGLGKFIFDGCGSKTRKGRTYIQMKKYE